jgi:membrane associated rhomboid family serine protease
MANKKHSIGPNLFGKSIFHPLNAILILNCIAYLLQLIILDETQPELYRFAIKTFGLEPSAFINGKYWQIITYGFLHTTSSFLPFHLIFNMYGFYLIGGYILPLIGKTKFTLLYITSLITGGVIVVLFSYIGVYFSAGENTINMVTIGASGAVFGLMAVFGIFFPDMDLLVLFITIKAKNAVWFSLLMGGVMTFFGSPISNTCHFGGALGGFVFYSFFIKNKSRGTVIDVIVDSIQKIDKTMLEESNNDKNLNHIKAVRNKSSLSDIEEYLNPYQVKDANICPPSTFNTEDSYCLQCDWLPNCLLRKSKNEVPEK